ncbi:MAG: hypothetical protein ABIR47_00635, partial [Candidatus Kapaibacterium sp.]
MNFIAAVRFHVNGFLILLVALAGIGLQSCSSLGGHLYPGNNVHQIATSTINNSINPYEDMWPLTTRVNNREFLILSHRGYLLTLQKMNDSLQSLWSVPISPDVNEGAAELRVAGNTAIMFSNRSIGIDSIGIVIRIFDLATGKALREQVLDSALGDVKGRTDRRNYNLRTYYPPYVPSFEDTATVFFGYHVMHSREMPFTLLYSNSEPELHPDHNIHILTNLLILDSSQTVISHRRFDRTLRGLRDSVPSSFRINDRGDIIETRVDDGDSLTVLQYRVGVDTPIAIGTRLYIDWEDRRNLRPAQNL